MKKVISIALAITLFLSISIPVFANGSLNYVGGSIGAGFNEEQSGGLVNPQLGSSGAELDIELAYAWRYIQFDLESLFAEPITSREQFRDNGYSFRVSNKQGADVFEYGGFGYDSRTQTAYSAVSFVPHYPTLEPVEFSFDYYLAKDRTNIEESKTTIRGYYSPEIIDIDSTTKNLSIDAGVCGTILNVLEDVKGIEILLDDSDGVIDNNPYLWNWETEENPYLLGTIRLTLIADLKAGEKYYIGSDMNQPFDREDEDRLTQYKEIINRYPLSSLNLENAKIKIEITSEDYGALYLYDENLNHIGGAGDTVSMSSKYYISYEKLDISTGSGGGSSSKGSSSGGGSSGGSSRPDSTRTTAQFLPSSLPWEQAEAAASVREALTTGAQIIRVRNRSTATLEALRAAAAEAGTTPITVHADTLNPQDNSVDVRLSFQPKDATKGVNLYATTALQEATQIKERFRTLFGDKLTVVYFAQQDGFGMEIEVAANLHQGADTESLAFYTYNAAANTYTRLNQLEWRMDANGYVHFEITKADAIVIVG